MGAQESLLHVPLRYLRTLFYIPRKSQVWLVAVNIKWLSCNQCKVIVVWMGVQVVATALRIKYMCLSCFKSFDFFWICESGIYMRLLNRWLNLCPGFWLVEKTEKELKVGTMLDEIASASLTTLWLHWSTVSAAWCHWIIIKHTCDVNSAISLHLLLHYLLLCKKVKAITKSRV